MYGLWIVRGKHIQNHSLSLWNAVNKRLSWHPSEVVAGMHYHHQPVPLLNASSDVLLGNFHVFSCLNDVAIAKKLAIEQIRTLARTMISVLGVLFCYFENTFFTMVLGAHLKNEKKKRCHLHTCSLEILGVSASRTVFSDWTTSQRPAPSLYFHFVSFFWLFLFLLFYYISRFYVFLFFFLISIIRCFSHFVLLMSSVLFFLFRFCCYFLLPSYSFLFFLLWATPHIA